MIVLFYIFNNCHMKNIEINWSLVCYDSFWLETKNELRKFIDSQGLKGIIDTFNNKIVVVLWWDGTMLRAIREHYAKNLPFLGINFWHKWFLLNSKESIYAGFEFLERKYPLLEVEVWINWDKKSEVAMNEIDIRAWAWKMVWLDISLSRRQKVNLEWDWVIISTPAWSTWYNRSLQWPIIPHTLNAFAITPKAPWKPRWQSPILINDNETIWIKNTWRKYPVEIYSDWRLFLAVEENNDLDITITKSKELIKLIIAKNYIDTWDNKVLQEQGFEV